MRIVAEHLGHSFEPGQALFDDLSFQLDPGSLSAVVGPSGSGKSTLLSMIAGWLNPSRGRLVREMTGRTVWVFQNPNGVSGRTAIDHVSLPYLVRGYSRTSAHAAAIVDLARFGLAERADARFRELSGGEAQRLMLARAAASQPALLLIDEPTAALDRAAAALVTNRLISLCEQDRIVVVSTHDDAVRERCGTIVDLGRAASCA